MYQFGQEEITELLPLRILHPNTDIRQDHSGTSSGPDSLCGNYTVAQLAHLVVMILSVITTQWHMLWS